MPGFALNFDGVDEYVSIGDKSGLDPGAGDFTVKAWVKRGVTTGVRVIASKTDASNGWVMFLYGSPLYFTIRGSGGIAIHSSVTVPDEIWTHVAFTKVSNAIKVFVNGVDVTSIPRMNYTNIASAGKDADIGRSLSDGSYFKGAIDEFVFYNRGLSDAEILADYNSDAGTYTSPEANTQGIWHIDEGTGITTLDSSGNGYTGTLTNMEAEDWVEGKVTPPSGSAIIWEPEFMVMNGGFDI